MCARERFTPPGLAFLKKMNKLKKPLSQSWREIQREDQQQPEKRMRQGGLCGQLVSNIILPIEITEVIMI